MSDDKLNNGSDPQKAQLGDDEKKSPVFAAKNNRNIMYIVVGALLLLIILYFILHEGEKSEQTTSQARSTVSSSSRVFDENQARLRRQAQTPPVVIVPQTRQAQPTVTINQTSQPDRDLQGRLNAPMEVFDASGERKDFLSQVPALGQGSGSSLAGTLGQYGGTQTATVETVRAQRIAHPYQTIVQGEFIHAVLETAINSDLPGMVRATVSEPVYAYRGATPLIPAGSRLIGQYVSAATNGMASSRVFIMWNRIVTPDGVSLMINSPGADRLGRAGQKADAKNSYFLHRFGMAALISLIGAGTANIGVNATDQYNSASAYRTAVANSFNEQAGQVLSENQNIQPTLHIHQGAQIIVFVAKDLDLTDTQT